MEYISTVKAAEKWQITPTRITILAKNGRIPGAVQIGSRWMIPFDAEKPLDGRTSAVKASKNSESSLFRFPAFCGSDAEGFNPPLSKSELRLKAASEAFHRCDFEEAKVLLGSLYETEKNRYCRIYALYLACMIHFLCAESERFFDCYDRLYTELKKDFPYKKEMSILFHEVDASIGMVGYFIGDFDIEADYRYHESFLSHLTNIALFSLNYRGTAQLTSNDLNPYEILCRTYREKDCPVDLQSIHFYLGLIYGSMGKTDKKNYHIKKAFELTEKYNLYFQGSVMYYYYGKAFEPVLSEFSEEFRTHLAEVSEDVHDRYSRFLRSSSIAAFYNILLSRDYILVYCAVNGYSNKQVAELLKISVSNVGNRYSAIYSALGLKGKKELVEFYRKSVGISLQNNKE